MQKRKYVQVKLIEDQIQLMRAEGMTNREIADRFAAFKNGSLCSLPDCNAYSIDAGCNDQQKHGSRRSDNGCKLCVYGSL